MKAAKHKLEGLFVDFMRSLQPEIGYMRLFREIVKDVWKHQQADTDRLRANLEATARDLRGRAARVDDAFLHERTIDRASYERQRDKLREQLALAEMELTDVVTTQLDVEGVLGFAEHVLTDAARLWSEVPLDEKRQLQQAIFPEGLRFDGEQFETAVTCLAFKQLGQLSKKKSGVASPTHTGRESIEVLRVTRHLSAA